MAFALLSCKTKEEKQNAAEEDGAMLVEEPSSMAKGEADSHKKEGKNAGAGIDKSMTEAEVILAPDLDQKLTLGLVNKSTTPAEDGSSTVSAFIDPKQNLKGVFTLKAFTSGSNEIGRSKYGATIKAGNAQYHDFKFDERTPMDQVSHFELSFQ